MVQLKTEVLVRAGKSDPLFAASPENIWLRSACFLSGLKYRDIGYAQVEDS
jgi:hypothetical protein